MEAKEATISKILEAGEKNTSQTRRRVREKSEKEIVGWRPVDDAQGRAIIQR